MGNNDKNPGDRRRPGYERRETREARARGERGRSRESRSVAAGTASQDYRHRRARSDMKIGWQKTSNGCKGALKTPRVALTRGGGASPILTSIFMVELLVPTCWGLLAHISFSYSLRSATNATLIARGY